MNVGDGIVRARHRSSGEPESLFEPDEIYMLDIELEPIAWHFAARHRLRLKVSSGNFPRYSRSGNSSSHANVVRLADLQSALQRVFHDVRHPSALVLPAKPG